MTRHLFLLSLVSVFAAHSQPAPPPITQVMATLTVRPGVTRESIQKVMPEEVRDTLQLYLDGKIQQWYSRGDGKGVIFILNCQSVEEAKSMTGALPLVKGKFVDFEYMPLGPLMPLRMLLAAPAPAQP